MNDIYLYNYNFISLLNLIKALLKNNIKPFNIKNKDYTGNLFDNIITMEIKDDENIVGEFVKIFGNYYMNLIYYVYLSNSDNKEIIIYYFLLNYFKYKDNLTRMRNLKCVSETLKISEKVSRENHRFKGFTRFKEFNNGVLYAEINPDNDILYLLSIHFKNRLKYEYWIIKDINRNILSIYDKKNFYFIMDKDFKLMNTISDREIEFAELWCSFYKTIGIKERKNDKCRMSFMPKKYWSCLLEMRDEL